MFFVVLGDVGHCESSDLAVDVAVCFALKADYSEVALVHSFVSSSTLSTRVDSENGHYFYSVTWCHFVGEFAVDD